MVLVDKLIDKRLHGIKRVKKLFEPFGILNAKSAVLFLVNKIVVQSRDLFGQFNRFLFPHSHKRRGIGIGSHAVVRDDRRPQDILL